MTPDNSAEARAVLARAFRFIDSVAGEMNGSPTEGEREDADDLAIEIANILDVPFDEHWPQASADRLTLSAEQNTGGMPGRDGASPVAEALKVLRCMAAHADEDADDQGQSRTATQVAARLETWAVDVAATWKASAFPRNIEQAGILADRMDALLKADAILAGTGGTGAEGWRDIASAPKDGTPILIFQPDAERKSIHMPIDALALGECTYRHDDPRLQRYDDHRWAIGYWRPWGGWGNRNCARVNPTHWQPLPTTPGEQS